MLTPNMFGTEFAPIKHDRFGSLRCGQMGRGQLGHNSGWYNHLGEKIGWGDLDLSDVKTLMKGLEPGEMFVTLSEQDSHWNFVSFSRNEQGVKGQLAPEALAPGFEYVCSKACYIVTQGTCYVVDRHGYHHAAFKRGEEGYRLEGKHLIQNLHDLDIIVLNAESAKELLSQK